MAAQEDVSAEDAAVYGSGSYVDLYKGALTYTDVVLMSAEDVNPEIRQFIEDNDVRIANTNSDEDYEAYAELYEEFASEEVELG
jgi:starch synthase